MAKRIEYIDAMRGLAMLLVVIGHVFVFSFKNEGNIFFQVLSAEIEVPLFFMVSGFLMRVPEQGYVSFFKKKAFQLCVPAVLFMSVYLWNSNSDFHAAWFNSFKYGYWFTFSLFEFIVLYVMIRILIKAMRLSLNVEHLLLLTFAIMVLYVSVWCMRMENSYPIIPLLGLVQFKSFVYFVLGVILAERNILINSGVKSGGVILSLCILLHFYTYKDGGINYIGSSTLWFALTTVSGLMVLLMGFQQYTSWSTSWVGRKLQMIGQYTLDIYFRFSTV